MNDEAQRKIDAYLGGVRDGLRGLSASDIEDILAELRAHITEKAGLCGTISATTVDSTLASLGDAGQLASEYATDALLARAEVTRSPLRLLESLFRWASLSLAGFVVLLGSVSGYVLAGAFLLAAVLKPLHPEAAGLWVSREGTGDLSFSLHMGFGSAPAGGEREILGWWILPLGLLAGCGLAVLTTRIALWCARYYRQSRSLPRSQSNQ